MNDILKHLADLSPEKRRLLQLLLKEEGVDLSRSMIIPRRRDSDSCPLSFAQQRLWFLDQLEPNSAVYNIPTAVRLTGSLNIPALEESLYEIVRRHESLRTTFAMANGQPMQVIVPDAKLSLPIEDLSDLPQAERETEALRLATREARRPFDLTRGPLLRVRLLRLDEREHIVLLTMHHIVSDGWSMGVFIGEIAALYPAFCMGAPSLLPELRVQYADYAVWQQQWLQGQVLEEQLAYWKQQLAGSPPKLELPTDRPRPAVQTAHGAEHVFNLPRRLYEALQTLSQQEHVTLFMLLMAAFQTLLYRYTGQEDICVGTPIANRNRAEIEGLIGFFVNTLVLRTDLSGNPSFRDLLKRVREVAIGAYAHQDLPFEMLVDALHPDRDTSYSPLFQVMFALQTVATKIYHLPELILSSVEAHSGTAKFDLTLAMAEDADGLSGTLEYNTDLWDAATIERMVGHFQTLLEGIAADPNRQISTLPLLAEAERRRLLVEWNNTAVDYPRDVCIHQLFEAQVERVPDAVAAVFEQASLTYRELNRRANQLAHYLRSLGVGPDVPVAVCVERSLKVVVGLLGILKAGGAYVPLDAAYPPERLAFILADTQAPVLLTQAHLASAKFVSQPSTFKVVCLDTDWPVIAQESEAIPVNLAASDDLAYVIYTSGSTGNPKGVCCQHAGVINNLSDFQHREPISVGDGCSWWTSLNFDVSVYEIFSPLLVGGTLHIAPERVRAEGQKFVEWLSECKIRSAYIPPFMVADLDAGLQRESATCDLRRLLVGVEPIKEQLLASISAQVPALHILNGYGPTEATICCTLYSVSPHNAPDRNTPIGKPMSNTQIYLLDPHLRPVPIGVPGELYIGGDNLARGYLNRPELTAERFILNPFAAETSARLYKTGDLTRYLPDGNIEFIGRTDFQVKVRGYRIELGEIEEALRQHPSLREVLVLAREDTPGDKRLVAYAVPRHSPPPTASELRSFLKDKLPEYMLPSAFVLLEAFPVTPNGKVDRRALPEPDQADAEPSATFVAPRTPTEEILVGVWAQVLGIKRVSIHDNFFELGGHSLLATQIISRLRDVFQVELPLRSLFEAPTVAGLAEKVERARQVALGLSVPPIRRVLREGKLPLSFAQQRLWFLDQLEPGSPLYNIPEAVRLTGLLDVAALERSLNEIVRRHESLRTFFVTADGQPAQIILPALTLKLPVVDLSGAPESEREAEAFRLATEEAQCPFDLAHGPLLRARLLRLDEQDCIFLLTMHHIISDGWSTGVLIREVAELYVAFSAGQPSPLPDLPIQYADFASWQREWLRGDVLESQLSYWKQQLSGSPPLLELPADRPRPAVQTLAGAHQTFTLPKNLSQALKDLSQREGTTLFMTLLAAFQALLSRYTGQEDICVGTPIANRNRAEVEPLIGFFVNTLALRSDLSGDLCFRELLKRVSEVTLGAYAHQDLPFEMLVDALQPKRDMSHTPLFQVMFILQNAPVRTLQVPGLTLSSLEIESGLAMFDLTLTMAEEPEGLGGVFEYNTDLFDAETIVRMVGHFQTLLEGIVSDPDQHLSALPLLTEVERHRVLVEWNSTAAEYPADRCVHHMFEAQVEVSPEAIAAVVPAMDALGAECLTYRELNQRANRLAHYLHKLGVGPDTLVGLCVERSLEMMVGLLGVLKAGGAYLPLDPAWPTERLAFMLQDSRAPVVLTQSRSVSSISSSVPPASCQVVCLDADWETIEQESDENPIASVTQEDLAYVIYTSGSTGQPKGVMVQHGSVVNHNVAVAKAFHLQPSDRVLQFATINFDAAAEEMYPTWMSGATVVLRPEGVLTTGTDLLRLIESQQLTVLDLPTAYWHEWVYELSLLQASVPKCVRLLVLGGEKASSERMTLWHTVGGADIAWLNTYGPTEGTISATLYDPATDKGRLDGRELPIGRPIANAQIYLLDKCLQPVPIGVPGELHIGGVAVARGYLNRPGLTAEKFILDPFSDLPGARLYKTGDLARYWSDGNVEFLGRLDHQVKVRGFRVELGEIETVLSQHPAVREAIVLAREDEPGHKRLVAYMVPIANRGQLAVEDTGRVISTAVSGQPSTLISELRAFLKERLPEYMSPSAFVTLNALPKTPSGKVDRRALPAPDGARPELEAAYVAPTTSKEKILSVIWAQVLGLAQVGIHDNFFELGGDSILSIQVIARAHQAGLRLTPKQLFEHPTVAGLAAVAGTAQVVQAEQGIVTGPVLLTPIQHWFFEQDFPEPHHWNQSLLMQVREPLAPSLLKTAIQQLLIHHDALRLRFRQGELGWQAVNAGVEGPVPFEQVDLSTLSQEEQARAIESFAAELQTRLNLSEGPLLRVAHFDLGTGRPCRLLMVIHHLVVDGISWRILLEDLLTVYQQSSRGEAVRLPPKTTSFQHWAQRLTEYEQSKAARQDLDYWLAVSPTQMAHLYVDFPEGRADYTEASASSVVVSLKETDTQTLLRQVPEAYHTEINDVLLTALAQAFAWWTGSRTLLVDLEGHGREDILPDVDVSRTAGWFTTVYPVLLNLGDTNKPGEALKAIKEQLRRVPKHGISYGVLRYLSEDRQIVERLQALPQPEVSFNYLGQMDQTLTDSLSFAPTPESTGPNHSPLGKQSRLLDINGGIGLGRLRLEWTFNERLFRRATVEQLAHTYIEALRSLIAHCQSVEASSHTPSDFPLAQLDQRKLDKVLAKIGTKERMPR